MNSNNPSAGQLGFDALLSDADSTNRARKFERETGHLPDTMDEALPFYRALLRRHHAAMLAANTDEVIHLKEEARKLALRLNNGEPGILASENSPGRVLSRETAATPGLIPLWGQDGTFTIDVDGMKVRIELNGLFGVCSSHQFWPGFSAHVVNWNQPFLSQSCSQLSGHFGGTTAGPVAG